MYTVNYVVILLLFIIIVLTYYILLQKQKYTQNILTDKKELLEEKRNHISCLRENIELKKYINKNILNNKDYIKLLELIKEELKNIDLI